MTTIQAIETRYAGCRFRSRLEARWCVFFQTLGIKWEYEPQGFELPSGEAYLPDFHLPELDLWVEVKGSEEEFVEHGERYAEAALSLGGKGLLILGPMPDVRLGLPRHFVLTPEEHCCGKTVLCLHVAWVDILLSPATVREFGIPSCTDLIAHDGGLPPLKGYDRGRGYTGLGPIPDWPVSAVGVKAYDAARSARFEHGEQG